MLPSSCLPTCDFAGGTTSTKGNCINGERHRQRSPAPLSRADQQRHGTLYCVGKTRNLQSPRPSLAKVVPPTLLVK